MTVPLLKKLRSVIGTSGTGASPGGQGRLARVALSAGSQLVAKVIAAILLLVTIRWTHPYLNEERQGTWITISSLITGLTWADLGIGNALITHLTRAAVRGDQVECRRLFSSAAFFLAAVGGIALVVLSALAWTIDLGWFLKLKEGAEARETLMIAVLIFSLSVPFTLIERVRLAFQESHVTSWFLVGSGLLSLGLLAMAAHARAPLPVLLMTLQGPPLLGAIANALHLFATRRRWLLPARADVRRSHGELMLRTGAIFLALNLLQVANFQIDNLIIARIQGTAAVTYFSYHLRPFAVIQSIQLLCIAPLWPAYAEAITLGEFRWVKRLLLGSMAVSILLGAGSASLLLLTGDRLIPLWVGTPVNVSHPLLWALALWNMLAALGATVAVFWNSASLLRSQLIFSLLLAGCSVPAKLALGTRFGLTGIVWATTLSYVLVVVLPCLVVVPRQIRRLELRQTFHADPRPPSGA